MLEQFYKKTPENYHFLKKPINNLRIAVIIPALNEEIAIGKVIKDIPENLVREIIVVDNGSTDQTGENAKKAGATVLSQPERGYGNACLKGIEYIAQKSKEAQPDIVVFLDGDYSDYPEEMIYVVEPIITKDCDLVIGSRATGERQKGAMTVPQIFGNWLSTRLIRLIYGVQYTDLGPFRAIRWEALQALQMEDKNFGWTVEMQAKAAKKKMLSMEIPVRYRRRVAGKSKVSGTIKGTFLAGYKILWTIFKIAFFYR